MKHNKPRLFSLDQAKRGIICGAGGGIGYALIDELLQNYPSLKLIGTYRSQGSRDKLEEFKTRYPLRLEMVEVDSLNFQNLSDLLKTQNKKIDFVINTVGFLHDCDSRPERKLEEVKPAFFIKSMETNVLYLVALAQVVFPYLRSQEPSLFCALSAKVGSIDDNTLGGWYSYRASKAALNMVLKNLAIEFARRACHTAVVAQHPGTTRTNLSEPFLKHFNKKLHTAPQTAKNILSVLDGLEPDAEAYFLSWDGSSIVW